LVRVAGLAAVLSVACIVPPAASKPPQAERQPNTSESDLLAAHARGQRAYEANDFEQARDIARSALKRAATLRVNPRMLAMLHELEGNALWRLTDIDADEAFESALVNWEKVPGARSDVARLELRLANVVGFVGANFDRAEGLVRHSMKLMTELGESGSYRFVAAHCVLLDILEQQCRTDEASAVLDAVEKLVNEQQPVHPLDAHKVLQFRALISRDSGDLARAVELQQRGLAELERLDAKDELGRVQRSSALGNLAEFERARGNYAEAAKYAQREGTVSVKRSGDGRFEQTQAEDLHFAYAATRDPKLAAHDEQHGLVEVRVGKELFPAVLPEHRACHPEVSKPAQGRIGRYKGVLDLLDPCLVKAAQGGGKGSFRLMFRVEDGRVVAVAALGPRTEPEVLRCAAERALDYQHPTERYNEFDYKFVDWP